MPGRIEVLVIFFDDVVMPDREGYRKTDRRSIDKLQSSVNDVTTGGGTNVVAGMQNAFSRRERPDTIFLLTDGAFDHGTPSFVKQLNADGKVRINTIALVSDAGESLLKTAGSRKS